MKFLKFLAFCIVVLALGISLGNVANLQNQNTNLKTDNEILMEQVAEYENNLTLTKAELIIAQNERQELVTTVNNYQNEVTELKSQAIIDTEKLAIAEANLATAEQALEAKDAEIAKLKQDVEAYELICGLANTNLDDALTLKDFDFTYESRPNFYPITTITNNKTWTWGIFSVGSYKYETIEDDFIIPCLKSYAFNGTETSLSSLVDGFSAFYDICLGFLEKGIELCRTTSSFIPGGYGIDVTFNILDFITQVEDGLITELNWFDFFYEHGEIIYFNDVYSRLIDGRFSYTDNIVKYISLIGIYPKSMSLELSSVTTLHVNGKSYSVEQSYITFDYVININDKISVDNFCLDAYQYNVIIDTHFKSFCVCNIGLFETLFDPTSTRLIFTENASIDKFYIPYDVDVTTIRSDIVSHVDEFVKLPFSCSDITTILC